MRMKNGLFSGTYPLIYSDRWSFYMQIHYMRAYFWHNWMILDEKCLFIAISSYLNIVRKIIVCELCLTFKKN